MSISRDGGGQARLACFFLLIASGCHHQEDSSGGITGQDVPLAAGESLASGWSVKEVVDETSGGGSAIAIRLARNGSVVNLAVVPPRPFSDDQGSCLFRSKNLCVLGPLPTDTADSGGLQGAVEVLGRKVVSRDRFLIAPSGNHNRAYQWLMVMLVLVLGIATTWILINLVRTRHPPLRVWIAFAGILILSFILRLTMSPWAFLHEYFHAAYRFSWLFAHGNQHYGDVGPALYAAVNWLTGGGVNAIFATNAMLSTLTVGAVILLDFALFRRWPRALFAGLILCFLPQHLRYSSSEVLLIPATLFCVWALAILVHYMDRRRLPLLLTGVLALFLATQSRPETMAAPVLAVLMVVMSRPRSDLRILGDWRVWMGAGILAALVVTQWFLFRPSMGFGAEYDFTRFHKIVWLDREVTSAGLWILWGLGFLWGLRHRTGATLWLLFAAALFTGGSLVLYQNPLYDLRTQVLSTPFHAMMAAGAIQLLMDWQTTRRWFRRVIVAVLLMIPLAGLVPRTGFVTERLASQQEWSFIQETLPDLPDGLGWDLISWFDVGDRFPHDLVLGSGKLLKPVNAEAWLRDSRLQAPHRGQIFYQGMRCHYRPPGRRDAESMRPECAAMHRDYVLQPITTRTLQGRLDPGLQAYGDTGDSFEVGFYRVVKARQQP